MGVADCRYGVHGTPDLSRRQWRRRSGKEVTISVRITSLAPNPAAGGARDWPLTDALGQPMGRVLTGPDGRLALQALDGTTRFRVQRVNVRGRGCTADPARQRREVLFQVIARDADAGGVQGFVARGAMDRGTEDGRAAADASRQQRGTGCGPSRPERGRVRPLRDPDVHPFARAKLSNGVVNDVKEYDAKPSFGNVVYLMTNTTGVAVGGVARAMVRVGTPVAQADRFRGCDPSSDGTLTWRYVSVRTGFPGRPRIYGWLPARCTG